jgi:AcrR family transcriptional regulator
MSDASRSDQRRQAILDVASKAFLEEGYAATSMSAIAARVGGSKGTLYNYFRSKDELFAAFMSEVSGGAANALFDNLPPVGGDLRECLIELGVGFVSFVLSDPVIAVHRLVAAECGRFPALGRLFYETGPEQGEIRLAAYFTKVIAAGQMRPCDPTSAARRFKDLCLSDIYSRRLWGVSERLDPAVLEARVVEGVDIFLAYYGR